MTSSHLSDYDLLRREFSGADGSFLIQLRCGLTWDEAAFKRLTQAMYRVAENMQGQDSLPKWLAQGFWLAHTFTAQWVAHPDFPKQAGTDYGRGCEILADLAHYLFHGEPPLADGLLRANIFNDSGSLKCK